MKMSDLKLLIKEEAGKLHRRTLLENEKKKLQMELRALSEIERGANDGDPYYDDPGDWQEHIGIDRLHIDDETEFEEYPNAEFDGFYVDLPVYNYALGYYGTGKVFAGDIIDFGDKGLKILDALENKIKGVNIEKLLTHQNFILTHQEFVKFIEKLFNEPMNKIVYDLLDSGVIGPDANDDDSWEENEEEG